MSSGSPHGGYGDDENQAYTEVCVPEQKPDAQGHRVYAKGGARCSGGTNFSAGEARGEARAGDGGLGVKAHVHAVRVHAPGDVPVDATLLGVEAGADCGWDLFNGLRRPQNAGDCLGAEAALKANLANAEVGPVNLTLGVGCSTGAMVKDGTTDATVLGCGVKVGKVTGVKVLDNELSVNFGKMFGC